MASWLSDGTTTTTTVVSVIIAAGNLHGSVRTSSCMHNVSGILNIAYSIALLDIFKTQGNNDLFPAKSSGLLPRDFYRGISRDSG